MRVIYADVLFALNALLTLLQTALTARLCRAAPKGRRLLAAGLLGGAEAMMWFAALPEAVGWAVNLLCAALIVLAAFGKSGKRVFARRTAVFVGVGAAMAGTALAAQYILRPADDFLRGGVYYLDVSPALLIGSAAVCYGLLRLIGLLFSGVPRRRPVDAEIGFCGRSVKLRLLEDSGNLLTDPLSGLPVAIADRELLAPLFTESENAFFENMDPAGVSARLRGRTAAVPCRTVGGGALLPAFRPDYVRLEGREAAERLLVAAGGKFGDDYGGILPGGAADGREKTE